MMDDLFFTYFSTRLRVGTGSLFMSRKPIGRNLTKMSSMLKKSKVSRGFAFSISLYIFKYAQRKGSNKKDYHK